MLRHLIKLIWNRKRSNFLLTTEIFASFIVLFGVLSLVFYNYGNFRQPLGYDYENVWAVYFSHTGLPDSIYRSALDRARQQMLSYPQIEGVTQSSVNTPFSMNTIGWDARTEDRSVYTEYMSVDEHYSEVMRIQLTEGRWIDAAEVKTGQRVAVLNQAAREALFGDGPAVGQTFTNDDSGNPWKVVGVTGSFKLKGEFKSATPEIFINHNTGQSTGAMLVRVKSSADAEFEADLLEELSGIAKGVNIELSYLSDQRRNQHNFVKVPMIIAGVVCGFLLLNVCLGLFGVLWYNIRKRREEIGLRRAVGATAPGISRQFVGEALVIASFGIAVGLFFTVQFPLLDVFNLERVIYVQAIIASIVVISALVTLCALYPSRQAATVRPAAVLHEE